PFGSSGEVAVRQPVLAALPFVPAGVWHDVQAEGRTTVAATLAFDWANSKGTTKVALTPRQAKMHISAIDLTTTNTSGRVEIRDGLITLRGMKGDAYGGRLETDGEVDFRGPGVRVTLPRIGVHDVDVRALPASWSVPPQLEGRLFAAVALEVNTADKQRTVQG